MERRNRKKNRLTEYDYRTPNAYFITVRTDKRRNLFWANTGVIINSPEKIMLTTNGQTVYQCICDIPKHYPMISVDHFVIMPNHIHLLLQIHTDHDGNTMAAPTIGTVVNQMKGAVSKRIGRPVWQKGFYDHIIRNNRDYQEIWQYIEENPGKWLEDALYNHPGI